MRFTKTTTLLGIATAAAMVAAPFADAQQSTPTSAAASTAKVTGAYLYIQKIPTSDGRHLSVQPYATLVFKTNRQLPRRFDGMLRAGARLANQGGSIGSVHGKASRCYRGEARIKPDNTITGSTATGITQTKARVGSRIRVQIETAKDAKIVYRTLTLRKAKAGDASGKPLGC
jgi:hypothetical protein